jgi:hypothetical protein
MVSDRIEIIYNAIDQMAKFHGKPRPVKSNFTAGNHLLVFSGR